MSQKLKYQEIYPEINENNSVKRAQLCLERVYRVFLSFFFLCFVLWLLNNRICLHSLFLCDSDAMLFKTRVPLPAGFFRRSLEQITLLR